MSFRSKGRFILPISLIALGGSAPALAQSASGDVVAAKELPAAAATPAEAVAAPAPEIAPERPFLRHPFLGFSGGVGVANINHPEIATPHVYAPMLGVHAGYAFSPKWSLGLQFTTMTWSVSRGPDGERFSAASSWLHTEADCTTCKPPLAGGRVAKTTMLASTLGPRFDVTPFGRDGLYLGLAAGLGIFNGSEDLRVGGSGGAHLGVRTTLVDLFTIGLEGGVQGQGYPGANVVLGYGALSIGVAIYKGLPPSQIGPKRDRAR